MPQGIDAQVEQVRARLGWSRSYFVKYALTKLLQELSVLTTTIHENDKVASNDE